MTCNGPEDSEACSSSDTGCEQELAQEHRRLRTFVTFPFDCPVSAAALARAGFVYTGEGDKVKCFSCHTTAEGWEHGESALERHKNLSPNCKFITESTLLENNVHPVVQNHQIRTENCSSNSAISYALDDSSDLEADYLLRTRQVVDMSDTLYPKNPAMCSEEARLKSFHNWPLYGLLTPKELANAGLYYTGVGDQVECFCCGGKLKNWEPSDRAWSEHKRHFPKCFFVLGRDVGNVPNEAVCGELERSALSDVQYPRNPSMEEYERRLQTFLTWRYPVNKKQLAKAGFYSIGGPDLKTGNGDHVVCFHCGGGLQEWKENEDPWDQHAKWFPGCRFLRDEKGQEFINNIHLRGGCNNSTIEAAEFTILPRDNVLENPLVKDAVHMGFSLSEIRSIMEKKVQVSGANYTSVEDLVADLISAQKESKTEEESNERSLEKDLSTEEKLRRLQEEKLCKICMAKDISIVLIPCGHLVACKECAEAVDKCPLCCTNIIKRQKIFMY